MWLIESCNVCYLVTFFPQHTVVCIIGDSENVRWQNRPDALILIKSNIFWIINGIEFEWIDSDENAADIGVNVASDETLPKIFQQC